MSSQRRYEGKCKWFKTEKGWGFITSEEVPGDIFIHKSEIKSSGPRSLADGEPVEFNLVVDEQGRRRANNLTGPAGASLIGSEASAKSNEAQLPGQNQMDVWSYYQYYWPQYAAAVAAGGAYAYPGYDPQAYAQYYGSAQQRYDQQVQFQQHQHPSGSTNSSQSLYSLGYTQPPPTSGYPSPGVSTYAQSYAPLQPPEPQPQAQPPQPQPQAQPPQPQEQPPPQPAQQPATKVQNDSPSKQAHQHTQRDDTTSHSAILHVADQPTKETHPSIPTTKPPQKVQPMHLPTEVKDALNTSRPPRSPQSCPIPSSTSHLPPSPNHKSNPRQLEVAPLNNGDI